LRSTLLNVHGNRKTDQTATIPRFNATPPSVSPVVRGIALSQNNIVLTAFRYISFSVKWPGNSAADGGRPKSFAVTVYDCNSNLTKPPQWIIPFELTSLYSPSAILISTFPNLSGAGRPSVTF
jgi:hypothetical protein